jgi:hypothetical protein
MINRRSGGRTAPGGSPFDSRDTLKVARGGCIPFKICGIRDTRTEGGICGDIHKKRPFKLKINSG